MIFLISITRARIRALLAVLCVSGGIGLCFLGNEAVSAAAETELAQNLEAEIQQLFDKRNSAVLSGDEETLSGLYKLDERNGLYAYQHEQRKAEYFEIWSEKQLAQFVKIDSKVFLRKAESKGAGYSVSLAVTTEYEYTYDNSPDSVNSFGIGTYHTMDIIPKENGWLITKEWYQDPFADSLNLDKIDVDMINATILAGDGKVMGELSDRRQGALDYADKYCGVARPPDYSFKYNSKYKNYNSLGGNCANFASQMLYEGGKFKKSQTWNYRGGSGSKAWVNAGSFNNYMIYNKRATLIAKGSYERVLEDSYKLLPGDYIAYEKKGDVTHISVVTGIDAMGYVLVNSNNTDRYRVPWDLGWSNSGIRFWLVRVNY